MERRNFLIAWITGILYAIFPSLRPKDEMVLRLTIDRPKTYGGQDLRELLRGNSEFRTLEIPYVIEEGTPIGLIQLEPVSDVDRNRIVGLKQGWTLSFREELTTGTTGGTRVTPAS
jgi:hypothetical protein